MSNKVYDVLNICTRLFVPIAILITTLLTIWNVPYTDQIAKTLVAIEACLGAIVTIAKANYDKANRVECNYEDEDDE